LLQPHKVGKVAINLPHNPGVIYPVRPNSSASPHVASVFVLIILLGYEIVADEFP
jgi:hypothetical protein